MIVIGAFLGQSTWNLVWIIAAFSWAPVARQMRAKTISIRRRDYVQMARSTAAELVPHPHPHRP